MSGLIAPNGAPLSSRKTRAAVAETAERVAQTTEALHLYALAFQAFMRLTFWQRMRWLLFGAAAFAPKPPTLRDLATAERAKREAGQ